MSPVKTTKNPAAPDPDVGVKRDVAWHTGGAWD